MKNKSKASMLNELHEPNVIIDKPAAIRHVPKVLRAPNLSPKGPNSNLKIQVSVTFIK